MSYFIVESSPFLCVLRICSENPPQNPSHPDPVQTSPLPIPVANTMTIVVKETESGLHRTFRLRRSLCILPASVAKTQPVKEWGGTSRRLCLHFCFGPWLNIHLFPRKAKAIGLQTSDQTNTSSELILLLAAVGKLATKTGKDDKNTPDKERPQGR